MKEYILVIDEGTTGVKSLLFNREFAIVAMSTRPIENIYPGERKVEQDGEKVFALTVETMREVVEKAGIPAEDIACIAITNQRATWGMWDKETGKLLRNLVTWQDTRGAFQTKKFMEDPVFNQYFPGLAQHLPGLYPPLVLDNIKDNEPEFAAAMQQEGVLWGPVDAFLLFRLTGGKKHYTSASTASCSVIYDNENQVWNMHVPKYVGIREDMLPEVMDESADYGSITAEWLGVEIPVYSMSADQQSAMFAQGCFSPEIAKCTNGTGTFVNVNIGPEYKKFGSFFTSIAWRLDGKVSYMFEGSSYTAGTCLEWAKDGLELYSDMAQLDREAASVPDSAGVYFVPALTGMTGAPYKDSSARASFMGIGAGSKRVHFVRAVIDSVAFAAASVIESFGEVGVTPRKMSVSGGVSRSDTAIQLMANVLDMEIARPVSVEASGLGAAEFAAMHMGWITQDDVGKYFPIEKVFTPNENRERDLAQFAKWKDAVDRSLKWLD